MMPPPESIGVPPFGARPFAIVRPADRDDRVVLRRIGDDEDAISRSGVATHRDDIRAWPGDDHARADLRQLGAELDRAA